jgi:putative ABC transport system substrate-binding protein
VAHLTQSNRRRFLALLACVAGSVPLTARAQQPDRPRVVGMLVVNPERDEEGQARAEVFRRALRERGWSEGRNLRLEIRWGAGDPDRARAGAGELLALQPDVIVVNGSPGLSALRQATKTVPIVFVVVTDPLGSGYVSSLARPGGNITGFSTFAPEIGGKWLGLLKEMVPAMKRVACILDPAFSGFAAIRRDMEAAAANFGLTVTSIAFRHPGDDLGSAIAAFAKAPNGGLVVSPTAINNAERERIIALAARYSLPAVYPFAHFADAGGLLAYGFDPRDLFARSAAYVDRILRGERPGSLPVQAPTKFEMIVNLKTARALDLHLSPVFLARADRVIE